MSYRALILTSVVGVTSIALAASVAIGQSGTRGGSESIRLRSGDVVPRATLLTERGRQLVEELKNLRRTEASMGPKHPTLPEVQAQILDVKEQIEAWSPLSKEESKALGGRTLAEAVPEMNDKDLRQLILRLSAKIELLERRVHKLEQQQNVF